MPSFPVLYYDFQEIQLFLTNSDSRIRRAERGELVLKVGAADVLKRFNEVIQNFRRNHDSVTVGAYFFRDAHHAASCIALEVDEEGFTIRNDFLCTNDIVVHCCIFGTLLYAPALI